jgi:hypothetical protein
MGRAIALPAAQDLLKRHPNLVLDRDGFSYEIRRKGDISTYTVRNAAGAITLPIHYAFGVDNQTYMLEYQGRFYESLVSYYESSGGLAPTVGDENIHPRTLLQALGRPLVQEEIATCFNCHGSGGVTDGKLDLSALEPGVTCEHCHPGSAEHARAAAIGQYAPMPERLGNMAAEDMSNFCGQCHRTWEAVVTQGVFGPTNARFQPYRLANSKCFKGDSKLIRCSACHNPHQDLTHETGRYDHVCLSCHKQEDCPTATTNCASCHMPAVKTPGITYTDHYIRVVHAGDPYPF